MLRCYITFQSVTAAQRGFEVLSRSGLSARLTRAPRMLHNKGCAYALIVAPERASSAVQKLKTAGIRYLSVFKVFPNGTFEEMRL